MNRQEYSDTYARENESRIAHREFLLQGVEKLTLFHDTFMKVVLNNLEVCQYVIRILMDDPTIEIVHRVKIVSLVKGITPQQPFERQPAALHKNPALSSV